ncbi:DNA repair protein [Helicobacter baculiformis]|uniref:DNA repair protein RecN n=1 Tax=Helicobacter baculiformis TaxID=427351 RepID=A0ABV7ZI51_9HELI|nr:DNA repair protein [Helicobacter baculiformis]
MIEQVIIKHGVVFEEVSLCLSPHLNVISGASGSGKSVLLGCILASVGLAPLRAKFLEMRYQLHNTPHVIRIEKDKKARCTHDGAPLSKKKLQVYFMPHLWHISSHIHTFDSRLLLDILDGFLDPQLCQDFQESYSCYAHARAHLEKLQEETSGLDMLKEMTRFELAKLQSVDLEEGAYARLEALKSQYQSREKHSISIKEGLNALEWSEHIHKALLCTDASLEFREALKDHLEEARNLLLNQMFTLEELEHVDMEKLLDEISQLGHIVRKYGGEAQARAKRDALSQDYQRYCAHDKHLRNAQERLQECERACVRLGLQLKQERQAHLSIMQTMLENYTAPLLLKTPHLSLEAIPLCAHGLENVRLLLGKSAHWSAGECNRLRLALLALQTQRQHPSLPAQTLLIDELDANLSGQESASVAQILKELSIHHQVIAISHAPHLPSLADRHFLVYQTAQQAQIKLLNKHEQVLEIARMVDANLGEEALAYAKMKLKLP